MRLISVDAFVEETNKRIRAMIELWHETSSPEIKTRAGRAAAVFSDAALMAKALPTVDAVEVVRCRDCVFYWEVLKLCCNEDGLAKASEEAYCPYGERKKKNEID